MAFDFSDLESISRRSFENDPDFLDAKVCRTTPGEVYDFKRRHKLPKDQRLTDAAKALLAEELEDARREAKGRQIWQAEALALLAERATPEAVAAIAHNLPGRCLDFDRNGDLVSVDSRHLEPFLLNRVSALTGKEYATAGAAWQRAAKLVPAAADVANDLKADPMMDRWEIRDRLMLFWGVVLRLEQLEGPPPADPSDFYRWCQLDAYAKHARGGNPMGRLADLFAGRMSPDEARVVLDLPISGPLAPGAIRSAYRSMAREHHPDAGGDRSKFERLSQARDRLLLEVGASASVSSVA